MSFVQVHPSAMGPAVDRPAPGRPCGIPVHQLVRLLDELIDAELLRSEPHRLSAECGHEFARRDSRDLSPQSFATLARIAAGEAWEVQP